MGHVTRELGSLIATLLAACRQVWFAQARLPEDCKRTLRDLLFVPGHLFVPNIPELLEKRLKLSEATLQLTQVLRNPTLTLTCQAFRPFITMPHWSIVSAGMLHLSHSPLKGLMLLRMREFFGHLIDSCKALTLNGCP